MRSLRDIKIKARRDLHFHAQVPALYISPTGKAVRLLQVRLHTKHAKVGLPGGDRDYAERIEVVPRIVFMLNQIAEPKSKAVVSFAEGEAYSISKVEPDDLITVTALGTRLLGEDTAGLPYPMPSADGYDPNNPEADIESSGRIAIPISIKSTEWPLIHNLGYEPEVVAIDDEGEPFDPVVEHIDANSIKITVVPARAGTLILK